PRGRSGNAQDRHDRAPPPRLEKRAAAPELDGPRGRGRLDSDGTGFLRSDRVAEALRDLLRRPIPDVAPTLLAPGSAVLARCHAGPGGPEGLEQPANRRHLTWEPPSAGGNYQPWKASRRKSTPRRARHPRALTSCDSSHGSASVSGGSIASRSAR